MLFATLAKNSRNSAIFRVGRISLIFIVSVSSSHKVVNVLGAMKSALAAVLATLLVGCATSPVKVAEARPVPPDRLLSGFRPLAQPSSSTAKIIVVCDAGILGAGAPAKLLVDGAPVARLWPGDRVQFFPSAGDHILGVKPDPQLMGALSEYHPPSRQVGLTTSASASAKPLSRFSPQRRSSKDI